jgi:CTP:phosphocholine cytidylyltransferase-like protein
MLLLFTTFSLASAKVPMVLSCLGKEELSYHKKKSIGALYHLNQDIISFFGKHSSKIINIKQYKNSCPQPTAFSFTRDILISSDNYLNANIYTQESARSSFKNTVKFRLLKLIIKFIIKTQENESLVDCVKGKSPSYKKIFFQLYYLEENINKFEQLIPKSLLRNFFEDLTKLSIARECSLPTDL